MVEPENAQVKSASPNVRNAGVIVVVLVAAAVRLIGLGSLPVWEDELSHIGTSEELIGLLLRWQTTSAPEAAPLPWIELKLSRLVLGANPYAMRFPSALYGIAATALLYVLIARTVGVRTALVAGLLFAVHPFALEWTRQTKMYGHTLFYSLLAAAVALAAVQRSMSREAVWHDWRWWTLGMAFMLMHACNPQLVVTIAAIGFWLCVIAGGELIRGRPAGRTLFLGSALAGLVYLGSWALTGVGKLLLMLASHKPTQAHTPPAFGESMQAVVADLAGYVPLGPAVVLWAAAVLGLVLLAGRGKRYLVSLLLVLGLASIASFPLIASKHFFATRYVVTILPAFCLGLGYLAVTLWQASGFSAVWARQAVAAVAVIVLAVLWTPAWREIYTVPRMAIAEAIAPLQQKAVASEVIVMIPDWYVNLRSHKPYTIESAPFVRPPKAGRMTVRTEADVTPGGSLKPFDADFYEVFDSAADPPKAPPAAWLFLADPERHLRRAQELLAAYGLDTPEHWAELERHSRGAATLTVRLSPGIIDHVTVTLPRRHAR